MQGVRTEVAPVASRQVDVACGGLGCDDRGDQELVAEPVRMLDAEGVRVRLLEQHERSNDRQAARVCLLSVRVDVREQAYVQTRVKLIIRQLLRSKAPR